VNEAVSAMSAEMANSLIFMGGLMVDVGEPSSPFSEKAR
jgi:hypothetical protein